MCPTNVPSKFTVAILPLGQISPAQIKFTAAVLEQEFGVKTLTLPAIEIPRRFFNAERNCYQTGKILNFLFPKLPANAQRIIGIVDGDLENPEKEPSFGSASPYCRAAIYMVPRISEQIELGQVQNQLDQYRLSLHLIIHEFAHTLGVMHCKHSQCAMNETAFEAILCNNCRKWADHELKVQPGSAEERFSFAESLLIQDCSTQAIVAYREAVSCAPNEPLYYFRLILALYKAGQKDEALPDLKLALALSNDVPGLNYASGLSLLRGDLESAEMYFAKAIAISRDLKFTQKLIGQAYREIIHDVERASRHYKEYLRLGGNDQDVIDWLISRNQLNRA